jgi:hypothetical protein
MKNKSLKKIFFGLILLLFAVIIILFVIFEVSESHYSEAIPFFVIPSIVLIYAGIWLISIHLVLYLDEKAIESGKVETLARWKIEASLWNNFLKHKAEKLKSQLNKSFIGLAIFFVIIVGCLIFYLYADDRPLDITTYTAGFFILILLIIKWIFYTRVNKIEKEIGKMQGAEILLSVYSLYINGELEHKWKQFISIFQSVKIEKTEYGFQEIVIHYLINSGRRRKAQSFARIPIPPDKISEAEIIVQKIGQKNKKN